MRSFIYFTCLTLFLWLGNINLTSAQGTSNKGTDFWLAYGNHVGGYGSNPTQKMEVYITSDVNTTGIVDVGGVGIPFTVTANTITNVIIPQNAYIGNTEGIKANKGIHITSIKPVVVYAHIYDRAVSGATLVLPTNTLGKEYYSINYEQISNNNDSFSFFLVVAVEDNTEIEITPSVNTLGGLMAGVPKRVPLNKGDVYQVFGTKTSTTNPFKGTDLTGSIIKSVSTGNEICKKIAVFSGSGKISIGCLNTNGPAGSADNLFQQVYPTATWGKKFITVPSKNRNYDIYRIFKSDPSATVWLNGIVIPPSKFINNLYYDFPSQGVTNYIESDKKIQAIQYTVTQGKSINCTTISGDFGDPEMIYLNPLEQTLTKITMYSTPLYLILRHYINVVIPTSGVSSFTIDGLAQVANFFSVITTPGFSYAQIEVKAGTHNLQANIGFNAIAYGFGDAESYGYAAGASLVSAGLQARTASTKQLKTTGCLNESYNFDVTLPYQPTKFTFDLDNGQPSAQIPIKLIKTELINGITNYTYELINDVLFNTAKRHVLKLFVEKSTTDGCGSNDELNMDLDILPVPQSSFTSDKQQACIASPITFTNTSNPNSTTITKWHWDFGDGIKETKTTGDPFQHSYSTGGDYQVTLVVESDGACLSSPLAPLTIHINKIPDASFVSAALKCETQAIQFTDKSIPNDGVIVKWNWDFGDGKTSAEQNPLYAFAAAGKYIVKLTVETDKGCLSTPFTTEAIVNASPIVGFEMPAVCLVGGFAQFTNTTTISDGTEAQLTYLWDFGDAALANTQRPNTSTLKNASHQYTKGGNYTVTLTVKSVNDCQKTLGKLFVVNITPDASFVFAALRCETKAFQFTDKSIPNDGVIVKWNWDFGDTKTSAEQNPLYAFAAAGKYMVKLTVETDKGCLSIPYTTEVIVYPNPNVDFEVPDFCLADGSAQFTNTTTISDGTEAQLTYLWDFGDAAQANIQRPNTSTLKNAAHRYTKAGRYTVKLTVKSVNGCEITLSKLFVVNGGVPKADFSVKNPGLLCSDKPVEFEDNVKVELDEEVTKIEWIYDLVNFPNTKEIDDTPAMRASARRIYPHKYPAFTSPASKTYTVKMLAYTGGTCVHTITKTVTVLAVPLVDFELPSSCLINGIANFKDKSSIAGTNGPFTYLWDFGDKNASATKPNTSTVKNPEHNYSMAGDYIVKLIVTSQAGCSTTFSKTLTVAGSIPVAAFTVLTPDKLCSDARVVFEERTTIDFGEITKIEWYYDYGNNPSLKFTDDSTAKRSNPPKQYSYTYPVFYTPATRTVSVKMVAYSGTTCMDEELQTITLHAVPRVRFDSIPAICSDAKPIQLTQAKEIHGVLTGTGTYSGKGVTPTGLFNQAITGVGTHTLTYTFVADNGCTDFKTQTITVNEIPTATIIPKKFVLDGGRIKLPAVATGSNLTYKWTPALYLDKDDLLNPVTTPIDDITYTLTVTTDKGCTASTEIFIKVLKFPEVPNSFTPNGDGVNDTWNVKYLESYPDATVHIFNRYGEKIFQTVNYTTPWDGTKNSSDLPVGTYYYIINPQNGRKIISGSVTIIR